MNEVLKEERGLLRLIMIFYVISANHKNLSESPMDITIGVSIFLIN